MAYGAHLYGASSSQIRLCSYVAAASLARDRHRLAPCAFISSHARARAAPLPHCPAHAQITMCRTVSLSLACCSVIPRLKTAINGGLKVSFNSHSCRLRLSSSLSVYKRIARPNSLLTLRNLLPCSPLCCRALRRINSNSLDARAPSCDELAITPALPPRAR
jgi:hypothetical protein